MLPITLFDRLLFVAHSAAANDVPLFIPSSPMSDFTDV